jgi:hypothetical protein
MSAKATAAKSNDLRRDLQLIGHFSSGSDSTTSAVGATRFPPVVRQHAAFASELSTVD